MSCCDRNTFTLAFMLLAVFLGSTGAHETGEEECHLMESTTAAIKGRPMFFLRDKLYGIIDSSDEELLANSTVWRAICPRGYTIITVVFRLNTSNEEYLQVKRIQLEGCADRPWSFHFNKKSVLVAIASSTNGTANGSVNGTAISSTFQLGYVCVGSGIVDLAERIFLNNEVLRYLKKHGTVAFSEAAELITDPGNIFDAYNKEHSRTILNMINKDKDTEASAAPATEGHVHNGRVPPGTNS